MGVRYWANGQKDVDVASSANWAVYGPYFGYQWGSIYYSMEALHQASRHARH
jgi:hypothetical protein